MVSDQCQNVTLFSSTVSLYKHYINRHLTPQRASQSPPAELQCETFQTDHPDALSKCCEEFLLAPLSITEVWVVSPHTDSQSVQRATEATPTPVRAKHTSALYSVNTHTQPDTPESQSNGRLKLWTRPGGASTLRPDQCLI